MTTTHSQLNLMPLVMLALTVGLVSGATAIGGQPQTWQPVGLCGGGGLSHPAISPHDPNTILMETDMGAKFRSHDGGRTWRSMHHAQIGSSFRACPPVFDPAVPGKIYAVTGFAGSQIMTSTDNGATWTAWPKPQVGQAGRIKRMLADPDVRGRLILGNEAGEVYVVEEAGRHWHRAIGLTGSPVLGVAVERSNAKQPRTYYTATPDGVFRSADDGRTFEKSAVGLPPSLPLISFTGGSNADRTVLYVVTETKVVDGKLAGGVYTSTDTGRSWQRRMNPDINIQTRKADEYGGGNFARYTHIRTNDVNPNRAYVYCRGTSFFPPNHSTIYRTDDAGSHWQAVFFVDPRFKQFNVDHDWMTRFRGTSWVGAPIAMEISPTDPDMLMRTDAMFAYLTTDGGKHWNACHAIPAGSTENDHNLFWKNNGLVNTTTWHYYIDPHQPKRHYIAYTDIGFARSEDGGTTWRWWGPANTPLAPGQGRDVPVPSAWRNTCYELAFDPDIPGKIWGAFSGLHDVPNENSIWRSVGRTHARGGICRSDDFGVAWQVANTGLPDMPALSIVLDPTSPKGQRRLYAAMYEDGVYVTNNDGATWQRTKSQPGSDFNRRICRLVLHRDGTLLAMVTGKRIRANGPFSPDGPGLYRSRDGGKTWQWLNSNNPLLYPKDFGVDPADSNVLFIGACDAPDEKGTAEQGGLYRSTDGGVQWQRVARLRPTHFGATFHPHHKNWVYATGCGWSYQPGAGGLWLSRDLGQTWEPFRQLPFASIHRVAFDPSDDGVIYVTSFGGSVWKGPAVPQ